MKITKNFTHEELNPHNFKLSLQQTINLEYLVWARYLDDIRVIPKVKGQKVKKMTQEIYNEKMDKIRSGVRNKYGTRKFSPYGSRRR